MKAALPQLTSALVYDLVREKAEVFCALMASELGFQFDVAGCMEEAVRAADVITIATAGTTTPVLKAEWVKPDAYIATQGTADIPDDLFTSSRVVFDEIKMHRAWKEEEEQIPEEQAAKRLGFPGAGVFRLCEEGRMKDSDLVSLSEIAYGKRQGRTNESERFVLIVGGMPVEDAAWGYRLYQNACKMKIGQELVLWDEPHWM
jgi:ornithine cyclodeaminase